MIAGAPSEAWATAQEGVVLKDAYSREIVDFGIAHPSLMRDPEGLTQHAHRLTELEPLVEQIRAALNDGAGFQWIRPGLLPRAYGRLAFGLLRTMLSTPIERYGFLYPVRDTGESYTEKAIPISMTRASTGLHTDSSARDCIPGCVALYCERPSVDGGVSCIADAAAACRWIAEHRPDVLERLKKTFIRKIVTPGLDKGLDSLRRNRFPIVRQEPTFEFRYMRYWIEEGQKEAGQALDAADVEALDLLDATLAMEEHQATFRVEAGDMLFVNNTHLVHGRSAYDAVPSGGRLLWRMWLDERFETLPRSVPAPARRTKEAAE